MNKQIEELRRQLSAAQAELDDREGMVCGDCNDTGWLESRVEGRHPCTCMTEAEPYQLLEQQLSAAQADNEQLVTALEEFFQQRKHDSYSCGLLADDGLKIIAAHKARQGKV